MYLINYNMDSIYLTDAAVNVFTKESMLLPVFAQQSGYMEQSSKHWTDRQNDYGMYYLLFTIDGSGELSYNEKSYILGKGTLVFIDANKHHFYKTGRSGYWRYCYLNLYGEACGTFYKLLYNRDFSVLSVENIEAFLQMFDEIHENIKKNSYKESILISRTLTDFFHDLVFKNVIDDKDSDTKENIMYLIINYIKSNFTDDITLSHLAREFNFSEEYLIRKFKKTYNITPHNFIVQLRIDLAKNMLLNTNYTTQSIAELCGFKSERNMLYCFNKYENTTPLNYKKNILLKLQSK